MKIISGDEFGLIKLISTQKKQVLDQYGTIDSSKSILNIFSNKKIEIKDNNDNSESKDEEKEEEEEKSEQELNLYVSSINENYILNWETKKIISSYKNENPNFSFISSTIKFPSPSNSNTLFINGTSDDKINIVSFNNENKYLNSKIFWPVDNSNKFLKIKLRGIANSIYNNNESVYCLYQNTPIVLYNIEKEKIEFKGKNLPHDELGLKIPIYDTDVVEIKNNPRLNYVSTAYGEIRFYDKKASPKPSMDKKVTKSKINKIDITEDSNYLFVADNQGYCAMLDIRKSFCPCKTFKGNTGSIKSMVNIEKNNHLIVAGFDRYIRWYDYKSGNNDKVFVKNKINTTVLVDLEPEKKISFDEEEESEIDDSEILDEEDENEEEEDDNESNEEDDNEGKEEEDDNEDNEEEDDEDSINNKKVEKLKKNKKNSTDENEQKEDNKQKENEKDKKNKHKEIKNKKIEKEKKEEEEEEKEEEEKEEEEKEEDEDNEDDDENEDEEDDMGIEEENEDEIDEDNEEFNDDEEEEEEEEEEINKKRKRVETKNKNISKNIEKNKKKRIN